MIAIVLRETCSKADKMALRQREGFRVAITKEGEQTDGSSR
jgi:hypothetical protein